MAEKWIDGMKMQEKFHPSLAHVANSELITCLINLENCEFGFTPYLIKKYDKSVSRLAEGKQAHMLISKTLSKICQRRSLDSALLQKLAIELEELNHGQQCLKTGLFDVQHWIQAQLQGQNLRDIASSLKLKSTSNS